jgi:hypothetical protein
MRSFLNGSSHANVYSIAGRHGVALIERCTARRL